ncbi:hypothetical protein ES332_A09G062300v1 [Gossypium tomentosum]|uniref:non-specific serine/threonine protein kinase n=1 Tax=Gossypium tomentosum TaxID=34277 RepID=A0A5D2NYZ0_GOSTO|nr:hypothetical protein ES332_A09G062300v1 [Gossypium tomentosum]
MTVTVTVTLRCIPVSTDETLYIILATTTPNIKMYHGDHKYKNLLESKVQQSRRHGCLLFLFYLIPFITIFQLSYAHDDDIHFISCAPFDCGNLPNISYSFWTDQQYRPSYCGYGDEGFKLKCMQNQPTVMTLASQHFQVLRLNQSRDSLTIKRVELNSTCPQQILITNLFNYSETAENIILLYDCRSRGGSNYSFSCRKGGREMFPVLFKEDENDCDESSEKVEIPVGKKAFDNLMSGTSAVNESLIEPFDMRYFSYGVYCKLCRHSGGRCGSNESLHPVLLCYCRDRPHRLKCQHAHGMPCFF